MVTAFEVALPLAPIATSPPTYTAAPLLTCNRLSAPKFPTVRSLRLLHSVPAPVSKTELLFAVLPFTPMVALLLNTVAPLLAINTLPFPASPMIKPPRLFQPEPQRVDREQRRDGVEQQRHHR